MAEAHPKAVGLDLFFVKDLQDDPSTSRDNPVDLLAEELNDTKLQDTPIAMAVRSNQELERRSRDAKEIRPATVELRRDEDGVVRSVCPEESAKKELPTLAEAMLGLSETKLRSDYDPAILFAPVSVPQADREPGVYIVTRETVASQNRIS